MLKSTKLITITKYKTKKNNLKWPLRLVINTKITSYSKTPMKQ